MKENHKQVIRKSVVAVTTGVFAASLMLTACSSSTDKTTASTPGKTDPAKSEASNPYAKKLTIKWLGHNAIGKLPVDSPMKKLIEEKFNVTLEMVPVDIFNKEQLNLYFADGKTADYIRVNTAVDAQTLIEQGLLKEIPEDKLRKLMPAWMKAVESIIDPKYVKRSMPYKGKIYGVPFINYATPQAWVQGVRKDWLTNVGITKLPETLDEYRDMLRKFTFNDPDKNGKNDTYGGHGVQIYLKGLFGIGGSDVNYYADSNGKVNSTAVMDTYKAYLKELASWYKEGLLDPESITDQRPQQRSKWANGKFGVLSDHPWSFASTTPDNLTKMVLDKNPSAKIEFLKPYSGPNGPGATTGLVYPSVAFGFGFGKDTSDEKMERVMAIKEYMAANDDFWIRSFYGEEGKGFTRNAEGKIIISQEYLSADKIVAEGTSQYYALRPETWEFTKKNSIANVDLPAYDIGMKSPVVYNSVNFTAGRTNDAAVKKGAAVNTIVTEFQTNVLAGKADLDKDWEAFKKRYMDAGGQEIINEYQKIYDEFNK